MNRNKLALAFVLLLALIFGGIATQVALATDTYVADEAIVCGSTGTLPAVVGAAITSPANRVISLKACVISSSSAQVVSFQDGSGGTAIAKFYLAANTPYTVDDRVLGQIGPGTTAGTGLYIYGAAGTVTWTARIGRR